MMPKKISKRSRCYFYQRLIELLVPDLAEATDGCNAQKPKTVVCRFVIGSSLLVQERHEAEGVSPSLPRVGIFLLKQKAANM